MALNNYETAMSELDQALKRINMNLDTKTDNALLEDELEAERAKLEKYQNTCMGGIARMTIRTGDIAGVLAAIAAMLRCAKSASILESMRQLPDAASFERGEEWRKRHVYIQCKDFSSAAPLMKSEVGEIARQYAKAKEAVKYKAAITAYEAANMDAVVRIYWII